MTNPPMDKQELLALGGLSEAQRKAIIQCVDALDELAGEGYAAAEEAIFELFEAFGGNPELDYREWIRRAIASQEGE